MVSAPALRIAFFGTPEFAVPTLDAALASRHKVVVVVTQPDRPRGRGQKVSDAPVKARAAAERIPILQPAALRDQSFMAEFAAFHVDLGVVAAFGRILTDALLATPRLGMINVHASLLPKYRGAAPVHRAIMAGETETGVTIMRVVQALDAGAMIAAMPRPIGPDETSEEVERSLAVSGAVLLASVLDQVAEGTTRETPQNDAAATYAPRLTRQDGIIDWRRDASVIHNQIRGLHPWPHAFSYVGGRRVIFWASQIIDVPPSSPPGTIVEAAGERLHIAARDRTLAATLVQIEGKRPMPAREFLAGHPLSRGARFSPGP